MERYRSTETDGVFLTELPGILENREAKDLEDLAREWMTKPSNVHVLDFRFVTGISPASYRAFVLYNQGLKATGKVLYCLGISEAILNQFRQHGLTSIFMHVDNIEDARKKVKRAEKPGINVEFLNPFISATKKVMETQGRTTMKSGKPFLQKVDQWVDTEIAGVITLNSEEFSGTITLSFTAPVFLKIYENMVGTKHSKIDAVIQDAAGELLNIIYGNAKTILNEQNGYHLQKAFPTVLVGAQLRIHTQATFTTVVLPFESSAGTFHISISMNVA